MSTTVNESIRADGSCRGPTFPSKHVSQQFLQASIPTVSVLRVHQRLVERVTLPGVSIIHEKRPRLRFPSGEWDSREAAQGLKMGG